MEEGETAYIEFVELENAFDSVTLKRMFEILEEVGIKYRERRILYNLFKNWEP